ncbi:MerR family DNA-binding transcriptional regulator [Promicromonospora xylanilytica]
MLTVGAFSRASGLPVSALRYYDTAGLLRPAHVDPATGYRWYTPVQVERAELMARMRRTGMPVADIRRAITADPVTARRVVDAHQRRLEAELATATAHLAGARALLSATTHLTVEMAALRAALRSVRHAVGDRSSWRALRGVLFDAEGAHLRLVATDRYRLAVSSVPATGVDGPPVRVIVPVTVVDEFLARETTPRVGVALAADRVALGHMDGAPVEEIYPDYRKILAAHGPGRAPGPAPDAAGATVTAPDLLAQVSRGRCASPGGVRSGRGTDLVRFGPGPAEIRIGGIPRAIAFNREYLTDALRSFGSSELRLTVGDRDALRLASVRAPDAVALVMPVRPDSRAA